MCSCLYCIHLMSVVIMVRKNRAHVSCKLVFKVSLQSLGVLHWCKLPYFLSNFSHKSDFLHVYIELCFLDIFSVRSLDLLYFHVIKCYESYLYRFLQIQIWYIVYICIQVVHILCSKVCSCWCHFMKVLVTLINSCFGFQVWIFNF
jgi:hypothetical protein